MHKLRTTTIDWESQQVFSQIADQINQPLADIRRLLKHLQSKSADSDSETSRLSSIMLESSEQIETLIEDILRIEESKRVEVFVRDKFKYPKLYTFDFDKLNSSNNIKDHLQQDSENRISKADLDWLMKLEATILNNIDFYGLNVSWLASKLAVSERQIFRKIEKFTHLTPNKYIRSLRLYKAKELLEDYTYSTVSEVACAVGLKDPYYFSNLYKKQFGVKPKTYLR